MMIKIIFLLLFLFISKVYAQEYYTVKAGDNLTSIARKHNTTVAQLISWNNLKSSNIKVNQKLIVGQANMLDNNNKNTQKVGQANMLDNNKKHTVAKGETLYGLAQKYDTTVDNLRKWNKLSSNNIRVGQTLIVSDSGDSKPQPPTNMYSSKNKAVLPLKNIHVLSEFGKRSNSMHQGIDFKGPPGEPIYAVLPGTVAFSGVQRGYGNVVIIEHENSVMTVYGHNESNLVKVGQKVTQGQMIAKLGNTGNTTAYHLHFEYRVNGIAKNPRLLLSLE